MARIAGRTIAACLAALALPATAAAQGEARTPPAGTGSGVQPGGQARPEGDRKTVTIGDGSLPSLDRSRGLADALTTLHSFLQAQTQAARAVSMNPTSGPVTELANTLTDELKELDLQLTALAQRLGVELDRGGPLGATETARVWAHEQRMLELEALRGRTLEAAFLAPLPDEMRFGQGLVNAAKLSGTLDPEVLRFLNTAGVQLQSYLERSRDLLSPRVRVATTAERDRG